MHHSQIRVKLNCDTVRRLTLLCIPFIAFFPWLQGMWWQRVAIKYLIQHISAVRFKCSAVFQLEEYVFANGTI